MSVAINQQIRFTKSFDVSEMLEDIRYLYRGLSESELVKLAISKLWTKEVPRDENGFTPRQQRDLQQAIDEANEGKNLVGPFDSIDDFLSDLKK
ncbi:TPA: hypothetical protein EYP45_02375 [Candidatus Peregrinibacteria bacterium]|nr:hypothetical protein [Candidatus Peregrinibacteria bacterium]